jgi:hypothetical protein
MYVKKLDRHKEYDKVFDIDVDDGIHTYTYIHAYTGDVRRVHNGKEYEMMFDIEVDDGIHTYIYIHT